MHTPIFHNYFGLKQHKKNQATEKEGRILCEGLHQFNYEHSEA